MRQIYFDNSNTSFPKAPGVGRAMADFIESAGLNGGQTAYPALAQVLMVRRQLARRFGAERPDQVIFTAGAGAALNQLVLGLLQPGDHVIAGAFETQALLRPLIAFKQKGGALSLAEPDAAGELTPESVIRLLRPETKAIMLLHGSNVSGAVFPLAEISRQCRNSYKPSEPQVRRAGDCCQGTVFSGSSAPPAESPFLIVDAAQTGGILDISLKAGFDAIVFSGHKGLLGPQGIGGFVLSDRLAAALSPVLAGTFWAPPDGQGGSAFLPDRFEPDTRNLPGIAGLGSALRFIDDIGQKLLRENTARLTFRFAEAARQLPGARLIGYPETAEPLWRCPIVAVDFVGRDNAEIAWRLDSEYGVMTRCGLQGAPLAHKTLGTFPQGTVRFSFGVWNTEEEIEYAIKALKKLLDQPKTAGSF